MTEIILKAEHLKKVFVSGKKSMTAVDDVSFELNRGECLGIVGESGSGKSTIAKMLTHLEPVTDGQIFLKGKDITNVRGKILRKTYQDIQMVFQNPTGSFDPRRTLGDGIGESLRNRGMKKADIAIRVKELLEQCGLEEELAKRYPHEVSGGQCQRAAIARALAVEPEVILTDEPTSALDPISTSKIEDLVIELKKQYTIVMVTHNMQQAVRVSDKTVFFLLGEVIEAGETEKLFSIPQDKRTEDYITGRFG